MQIEYFFSLNSPWTYFGHVRLMEIASRAAVEIVPCPVDFRETIFPNSGGLPVSRRPPSRQAYRLQELERWREHLNMPLNISPAFWPANEVPAETLLIALRESGDIDGCMNLAADLMRAVWDQDLDIGDRTTLKNLVDRAGLNNQLVDQIDNTDWASLRLEQSKQALERGVFGAPSYVVGDQIFWGQDRLDFIDRLLRSSR